MKTAKRDALIYKLIQKTAPAYDTTEDGMTLAFVPQQGEMPCTLTISYRNRYPTKTEEDDVIGILKAMTWKLYNKQVAICKRETQLHKYIGGSKKQWAGYTRITYDLATQLTLL